MHLRLLVPLPAKHTVIFVPLDIEDDGSSVRIRLSLNDAELRYDLDTARSRDSLTVIIRAGLSELRLKASSSEIVKFLDMVEELARRGLVASPS